MMHILFPRQAPPFTPSSRNSSFQLPTRLARTIQAHHRRQLQTAQRPDARQQQQVHNGRHTRQRRGEHRGRYGRWRLRRGRGRAGAQEGTCEGVSGGGQRIERGTSARQTARHFLPKPSVLAPPASTPERPRPRRLRVTQTVCIPHACFPSPPRRRRQVAVRQVGRQASR